MTLLAVERIKLFTTRSPWWCAAVTLAIVIGFAALMAGTAENDTWISVGSSQFGYGFGLAVIMVLAALSITTEYRFGTIKSTFLAVPNRPAALLAKTGVVALLALVIGELAAFGALGVSALMAPSADLALNSAADWKQVAGVGIVYALTAVMGVAVGALIRHSAGAISALLIYAVVVEPLVPLIPQFGDDIYKWLPFNVVEKFLSGSGEALGGGQAGPPLSTSTLSPAMALTYFAGVAAVLLTTAILVVRKRDA
ncbi:ABC transporter permease [Haloechinothrix halophila]|uniref:ABC transporter permease n=1 Tax=Haloechinothrix halophila TaxID=1069073 RepID=UPI00040C7400|nr:ABC transporter permease [Haloechinothrix halophila]